MAATFDPAWTAEDLAHAVCDSLVAAGKLKEKPSFIRTDREAKIAKIFVSAKLDGAMMSGTNARGVEVAVRNATEGEAWVDDVQGTLRAMLSEEAAASVEGTESEELKAIKAAHLQRAKDENPEAVMPVEGGRRGGGGGGGRQDDRSCFNCGGTGHISRDCTEPQSDRGGGGGRSQDPDAFSSFNRSSGGDKACYSCGESGHMSRDCPTGSGGGYAGGGGGGGRACYNCGESGHISRECPNPDQRGGGGGGGGSGREW